MLPQGVQDGPEQRTQRKRRGSKGEETMPTMRIYSNDMAGNEHNVTVVTFATVEEDNASNESVIDAKIFEYLSDWGAISPMEDPGCP
jgi:hypothetical protein